MEFLEYYVMFLNGTYHLLLPIVFRHCTLPLAALHSYCLHSPFGLRDCIEGSKLESDMQKAYSYFFLPHLLATNFAAQQRSVVGK